MIKIRVTSPFRYQYVNGDKKLVKDLFFAAGDYYHIDPIKDKLEAKFVLSPTFAFKNYIHIHSETVPQNLAKEAGLEAGFYPEGNLSADEEFYPTMTDMSGQFLRDDQGNIADEKTYDPAPNKFDLTSDPNAKPVDNQEVDESEEDVVIEEKPLVPAEEKYQGALNTPDIEDVQYPNEDAEEVIEEHGLGEQHERKVELESLHYKKVKEVAENYNLEYTNKKDTIAAILVLEFGDPDAEPQTDVELI